MEHYGSIQTVKQWGLWGYGVNLGASPDRTDSGVSCYHFYDTYLIVGEDAAHCRKETQMQWSYLVATYLAQVDYFRNPAATDEQIFDRAVEVCQDIPMRYAAVAMDATDHLLVRIKYEQAFLAAQQRYYYDYRYNEIQNMEIVR